MQANMKARRKRYNALRDDLSLSEDWTDQKTRERYALVQRDEVTEYDWLETFASIDDALAYANSDGTGFAGVRIVDLDTGEERFLVARYELAPIAR